MSARVEKSSDVSKYYHMFNQNKMFRLLAGKKLIDKVRIEELSKRFSMMSINQMACNHVLVETYNIIHSGASEKIRENLFE